MGKGIAFVARFLCLDYVAYASNILIDICPNKAKNSPGHACTRFQLDIWLNVREGKEGMEWGFLRLTDQGRKQILETGLYHKLQTNGTVQKVVCWKAK